MQTYFVYARLGTFGSNDLTLAEANYYATLWASQGEQVVMGKDKK